VTSTEIVVWQPSDASREHIREHRRRRRHERRWLWGIGLGCAATFATALTWLNLNQPPQMADAQEVVTSTTATPPSSTVPLVPESVPPSTAASWITVRVLTPGFDGLGKLLTDGARAPRVLPGDLGRAVVAVDADPSAAATVVVEGREFRVFNRSTVGSNELGKLVDGSPVVPVVVVVSSLPGDRRPYVEAK
jgi:hypothetical protein